MVRHSITERSVYKDVSVQYVLSALRPLIIQFDMINVQRRFCLDLWPGYCHCSPPPDAKEPQSKSSSSARSFVFVIPYFLVSLSFSAPSLVSPLEPLAPSFFSSFPLSSSFLASFSSCCCLFWILFSIRSWNAVMARIRLLR